jgi:cysteine sulfinate desulfinase/cysteine desulfurase-like protein
MLKPLVAPHIYLDFNASTPIAPEVADAMRGVLDEPFGNPSSEHWAGGPAKRAIENARAQVAGLLACKPDEIVFTSGGSEANNHGLKGVFFAKRRAKAHFITTQVEHPAVINPCRFLERLGATTTYLPVDGFGRVDPDDVRRAITPETILISVMHANNEVGTFNQFLTLPVLPMSTTFSFTPTQRSRLARSQLTQANWASISYRSQVTSFTDQRESVPSS